MIEGIEGQQLQLESALAEEGWSVAARTSETDSWCDHEIWTIQSEWRPVGLNAFLVFRWFPLLSSLTSAKEEGWWGLECTTSYPTSDDSKAIVTVSLKPWNECRDQLFENLSRFRDRMADFEA